MAGLDDTTQDLTVKGESVERLYGNYRLKRYMVNRRYQRKLVWTLEEKISFIDSIARGFPVPIILLAENKRENRSVFDIIDGMQRLNSIMAFLENEFSLPGGFFDLNTMAETKEMLDQGKLNQQEPVMPRSECVKIASYTIPLSIYEFSEDNEVDEVFRRINSGGRKLSRQELRIAGSTGHFADAVRNIACKIRGDVTLSDVLPLNEMKKISITNKDLPYGIDVSDLFWVKHGILTKEQVRESRDEEVIADMLAFVLNEPPPSSRSEFLDDYFGASDTDASKQRYESMDLAVQKNTAVVLSDHFQSVIDELNVILSRSGKTFGSLLFDAQPARAPRYFQAVFLALHELLIEQRKEVDDYTTLINRLDGSGKNINVPEGGRWGSSDRVTCIDAVVGMYSPAFKAAGSYDPAKVRWIQQLENILVSSFTEQASYDFKQGFLKLDKNYKFDEDSFSKILQTLVGIANIGPKMKGYVIVGIADKEKDAIRVGTLFGVKYRKYERFFITGVEHESASMRKTMDQYFHFIVEKLRKSSTSTPLRDYIARNVKLVRYYDLSVFVFETEAQVDPSHFDGVYYVRTGADLEIVQPTEYADLFRRFQQT